MSSASPHKEDVSSQDPPPPPVASSSRSIYSFWGNGAGPSQPPPPPPAAATKRKRKKVDDGPPQARISLTAGAGKTWVINKAAEEEDSSGPSGGQRAKGKGKSKGDGEEDELKEMAKRAKQAAVVAKSRKTGRKVSEDPADEAVNGEDSSCIGPASSPQASSEPFKKGRKSAKVKSSPSKANTAGRRSKKLSSTGSAHPPSPEIINVLSSDPPHPPSSPQDGGPLSRFNGHAFVTVPRPASVSSKGGIDDPIDIERDQPRPKKLIFAADNKAAHPLFARVAAKDVKTSRASSVLSDTTPSEVTEASATTAKKAKKAKTGKVHSFFSNGGQKDPGTETAGWGRGIKQGEEWRAPWPTLDVPDVTVFETAVPGYSGAFKRRKVDRSRQSQGPGQEDYWAGYLRAVHGQQTTGRQRKTMLSQAESTVPFVATHPAIQAAKTRHSRSDREAWSELYKPMTSEQVLGNEVEATYLRDWLTTLSVGGTGGKKRPIIRKVNRATGQLFEDWIVDDAGWFGDPVAVAEEDEEEEEEVEYVEYDEPDLAFGERLNVYPDLELWQLTNTILLTGPSGSGKTAAVYAAASELGWEVFEVNPGMGKRTGANLMSWVGDVGRNHLVVKASKAGIEKEGESKTESKGAIQSFFAPVAQSNGKRKADEDDDPIALPASQGSQSDPIPIEESPVQDDHLVLEPADVQSDVRQSLILIDEADILYAEESTFWPALAALISESRRPVIITCNDISRIQLNVLPLQVILRFQPPPSHVAVPYLESIALAQGLSSPGYAAQLYERCMRRSADVLDHPLPPNGNEPLGEFDLRRAIVELQLDRGIASPDSIPQVPPSTLSDVARMIETASWVDSCVSARPWAILEMIEVDRYELTTDDEMGYHALIKPNIHDRISVLPAYECSTEMSDVAIDLAGGKLPCLGDLAVDRTRYVRSLLPLLGPLIPLAAPLLPSAALFVHYVPMLQGVIEWEDVWEASKVAALSQGETWISRKTGRPIRLTQGSEQEERYLSDLEEAGLEAARSSRLPLWKTGS